jgi:hypothetical protein
MHDSYTEVNFNIYTKKGRLVVHGLVCVKGVASLVP